MKSLLQNRKYNKTRENRNRVIRNERKKFGCVLCGYNKCLDSLHFHHVGNGKNFGISDTHSQATGKLIKEMEKCVVVCANCHGEIHSGQIEEFPNINQPKPKIEDKQLKLIFSKMA